MEPAGDSIGPRHRRRRLRLSAEDTVPGRGGARPHPPPRALRGRVAAPGAERDGQSFVTSIPE